MLASLDYGFEDEPLRVLNRALLERLRAVDASFADEPGPGRIRRFVPLERIATSIQY